MACFTVHGQRRQKPAQIVKRARAKTNRSEIRRPNLLSKAQMDLGIKLQIRTCVRDAKTSSAVGLYPPSLGAIRLGQPTGELVLPNSNVCGLRKLGVMQNPRAWQR